MNAYRINTKLYFDASVELDQERLIPIFHRWIQHHELDELLIDVADYKHVPQGPGVMLIAHDANYAIDASDGALGLLYARKRPSAGDLGERLRDAFTKTLRAAFSLERDVAGLRIATDRWAVRLNDRLLAPNTAETWEAVEPSLREVLRDLYPGDGVSLHRNDDPSSAFGVEVRAAAAPGVSNLLERVEPLQLAAVA